jgi:hypothetical protein|tara:strand:+ start:1955 stop:2458 length:504 start_codon:yes stop_codon:yes gene_type:complete
MQKKVLSEQAIYSGDIKMPMGYEIDPFEMSKAIFESTYTGEKIPFYKTWDRLNKYIMEHLRVKHNLKLVNQKTWGTMYLPDEKSNPLKETNPNDLKNSPDFVCLYGINAADCNVKIYYDDNRRQGKSLDIPLTHNKFIMFPANNFYHIENNQKKLLNFIQTITYEYL